MSHVRRWIPVLTALNGREMLMSVRLETPHPNSDTDSYQRCATPRNLSLGTRRIMHKGGNSACSSSVRLQERSTSILG